MAPVVLYLISVIYHRSLELNAQANEILQLCLKRVWLAWLPEYIWKGCCQIGDTLAVGQVYREWRNPTIYNLTLKDSTKKGQIAERQLSRSTAHAYS